MSDGVDEDSPAPVLEISVPEGIATVQRPWSLVAHNKKVIKGWEALCQELPENSVRCFNWLRADPMRKIPGRC